MKPLSSSPRISSNNSIAVELGANLDSKIERAYLEAVNDALRYKEMQAERLENSLESLLLKQEAILQKMLFRRPGILTLPDQRVKWRSQIHGQQALLNRLQNRLDSVKEIHTGMGLYGPRINELAKAKVRHDKPDLANEWDEMRTAQRAHENLIRKQVKEKYHKEKLQREQKFSNGMSLTRTIT